MSDPLIELVDKVKISMGAEYSPRRMAVAIGFKLGRDRTLDPARVARIEGKTLWYNPLYPDYKIERSVERELIRWLAKGD